MKMNKSRLETFSDGVIAIIITLMVLDIHPSPSGSTWVPFMQHIAVYAISFLVLAVMWLNHHHMFLQIQQIDTSTLWLNMLLLFCMSLIPLPTQALGAGLNRLDSHMFYGLVLGANAIAYSLLQHKVYRLNDKVERRERRRTNLANWTTATLYLLSIPLSLISVYCSLVIFVVVPVYYFYPTMSSMAGKVPK